MNSIGPRLALLYTKGKFWTFLKNCTAWEVCLLPFRPGFVMLGSNAGWVLGVRRFEKAVYNFEEIETVF